MTSSDKGTAARKSQRATSCNLISGGQYEPQRAGPGRLFDVANLVNGFALQGGGHFKKLVTVSSRVAQTARCHAKLVSVDESVH